MKKIFFFWFIIAILLTTAISSFALSEWKVPITVTCNNLDKVLYFGSHPNASDAYDAGLDTLSPPPGFGPYAYFYIPSFPNFLITDIRKSKEVVIWTLKISNCSNQQVKIKWDLIEYHNSIGQNGILEIVGYGNMSEVDSLLLVGDVSLEIKYTEYTNIERQINNQNQQEKLSLTAFPNPFNNEINFFFKLAEQNFVTVSIYNILGELVTTVFQNHLTLGHHYLTWNRTDYFGQSMTSGLYFYRITIGDQVLISKIQLLK